jgi:hypothetical protein
MPPSPSSPVPPTRPSPEEESVIPTPRPATPDGGWVA